MNSSKQLIFNADDYGLCEAVNQAVEQLISAQRLSSVSVLANGDSVNTAVSFLLQHPHIDAGIHLNVVEGAPLNPPSSHPWLTNAQGELAGRGALLKRWLLHPRAVTCAVENEWRTQIETLRNAGLTLRHADSHQHLHGFPLAYPIAVRLCRDYGIPALRWPRERHSATARRLSGSALHASLFVSNWLTPASGLRRNAHFLGFRHAGHYDGAALLRDLALLPGGVTEVALHPSAQANFPYPAYRGDGELAALLDAAWPGHLQRLGVEMIGWRDV
ncbi:MAG: ChbG/HpnK family deacetylase [Acidobacteria bacterium]|nr:ChbG/HpnK family deacetylase [Acidobacteriota bacterium]